MDDEANAVAGELPSIVGINRRWAQAAVLAFEGAVWSAGGTPIPVRDQLRNIASFLAFWGEEYIEPRQWFIDASGSGDTIERLTKAIARAKVRVVFAYTLIANDAAAMTKLEKLREEIERSNCELYLVNDILPSNPGWQLIEKGSDACNRYETALSHLLDACRREKVRQGGSSGGGLPFGYMLSDVGQGRGRKREVVVDEDAARLVRLVFTLRDQGMRAPTIANALEDYAIKMNVMQVYRILKNEDIYRAAVPLRQMASMAADAPVVQPAILRDAPDV